MNPAAFRQVELMRLISKVQTCGRTTVQIESELERQTGEVLAKPTIAEELL